MFDTQLTARAAEERRRDLLRAAELDRRSRIDPEQIHARVRLCRPVKVQRSHRWQSAGMSSPETATSRLLRRGFALEYTTLAWNVIGLVILAATAWTARSVALAGFGLDSLIEIGASIVVVWELSGTDEARQRRALRMIGIAFAGLAAYLLVQSTVVLAIGFRPRHSPAGIVWTALTAIVMFALAAGKARTGAALNNPVLRTEGRVTLVDGLLAMAVLAGLLLNSVFGWWWADPIAGYVLVFYAVREVRAILSDQRK
jgi:divalent metal cation (Fe/Co/Zn/Cd) transporter